MFLCCAYFSLNFFCVCRECLHVLDSFFSFFFVHGISLLYYCRFCARNSSSVYFPFEVCNMLPAILSEDLCSLHPGCERLAVSVVLNCRDLSKSSQASDEPSENDIPSDEMEDPQPVLEEYRGRYRIEKVDLFPSVIRSSVAFHYDEAQVTLSFSYGWSRGMKSSFILFFLDYISFIFILIV